MLNFLTWYLTLTLIGWLTFPLVYRLFPAFTDRGYSLARTAGLLVWGYAFWMLASLGITPNNIGGILLGLAVLVGLGVWATRTTDGLRSIVEWVKDNLRLVTTIEILFLVAFAFMAFVRAANPEATGTEKPMELAFINAILRSPTFPPNDPWLSGYSISYYHFGYILTAMIAKFTATPGSIAFNLMIALVFALAAVGAYGVLYNLLDRNVGAKHASPLLAPLFLLLVSNLEGFLEVLRQRGVLLTSNFWAWLNIKELADTPSQTGWVPERYWWWWRASRVVQDYDLAGNFREVIDEFPFFSFLLGDLHPHVLSLPFMLLAVAVALNIFLGGWRGKTNILISELSISKIGLFITALVLGGLAFLNTWDILIAAALVAAAYVLRRAQKYGWSWFRLEDFILFGLVTGIAAILLYLPFYLGFASQAGGLLPNLTFPTRGAHLWVMFGTLLSPIIIWMIYLWRGQKRPVNWKLGSALAFGLPLLLWLFSWLLGFIVNILQPDLVNYFLQTQELYHFGDLFRPALNRRLEYFGGLLTLVLLLGGVTAFLVAERSSKFEDGDEPNIQPATFILLLIFLGTLLVLAPEFIYLRDQFSTRMNTIFKFYYQAWILWSLAAAYGIATLLRNLRGAWDWAFRIGISLLIIAGLTYPVLSLPAKTNNFVPPSGLSLDSAAYIAHSNPDEAAAIAWLQTVPEGILAEAANPHSYTGYARISTNTGLQTVLGWPGHESQWRGGNEEMGSRQADIETLYASSDWLTAQMIIDQYNIRYIYVGPLERTTYPLDEGKFERFLKLGFRQGSVTVYEVP